MECVDNSHTDCPFCGNEKNTEYILENQYAFAQLDAYPVTSGHSLIIPKRHISDWFEATQAEREAMDDLIRVRRQQLLEGDETIQGFNIGMNCGEVAGQTIFHCHIHLVPRRIGDTEIPGRGVRGFIKMKMNE